MADTKKFTEYMIKRGLILGITLVISAYFTILIANLGGEMDEIIKDQIYLQLSFKVLQDPQLSQLNYEERWEYIEDIFPSVLQKSGLNTPFPIRAILYLKQALSLNLGKSQYIIGNTGSLRVKTIILERVPYTLALFTTSTLISFILSTKLGLFLSRHQGGKLDKVIFFLSPFSTIPSWLYGLFFILFFGITLKILPIGGLMSTPPPEKPVDRLLDIGVHMVLPLFSWIVSGFFIKCIQSRALFSIFSLEDYVEVARAKGLSPKELEMNYILRPALPPVLTSFSLMMLESWNGSIILETVFGWNGLGSLTAEAIFRHDTPVLIGIVIIYAYLLASTVFLLDILYGVIDPRIKSLS